MAIALRKVNSAEDIDFNFQLLAQALSEIGPENIASGSLGPGQLGETVVPRSGGGFTGDISAPNMTASAKLKGAALEVTGAAQLAGVEASGQIKALSIQVGSGETFSDVALNVAPTVDKRGTVLQLPAIDNLGDTAGATYDESIAQNLIDGFNGLLSKMRDAGLPGS